MQERGYNVEKEGKPGSVAQVEGGRTDEGSEEKRCKEFFIKIIF